MALTKFLRIASVFALWKLFVTEAEATIPVCSPDNNNIDVSAKGQGVIATPNFPNGHKSASCVWKIQAPNNFRLAITIDVLKLQNWEDHIVIRDGPNELTPQIGKYGPCASGSVTLFSSDSSVYLQANFPDFSSNNELRITYSPVNPDDISCSNEEENPPNFCSADTKIQQSSGVISSPNFPNNYGASQSCVWTITAPEGYRVQLTIHWFGVEDHRYSPNRPGSCYDDSLIISEAVGSESRQIDKLCGCKGLITSVSSQEKMWLEFSSYKKANWPGFYATYQTLSPEECPAGDTNCTIKTMPAVGFDAQGQVCTVLMKTFSPSPLLSPSRTESSAMTRSQVQKTLSKLASKTTTTSRFSPSSVPIQIKSSIIQELLNSTQVTNSSINKEKANSTEQTSSMETRSPFVSKTTSLTSSYVGSAATSSPTPSLSPSRKESSAMTSSQVQKTSNELASKTSTTARLSPSSVPIQIKSSIIQELLNSTQVTNPSINKEKAYSMAQTSSMETRSPFVSKTTSLISSYVGSAATPYILHTLEARTHDRNGGKKVAFIHRASAGHSITLDTEANITVVCKPDYIEVVLMQANFPGIIVNDSVLHLEDVACVAGYKDAEMVKFTFDLVSCKTMIKVERDMVYYMNSVYLTADPETDGSEITRKNAQVIPFSCGYEKKATLSKISYSPKSTLVITDAEGFGNFTYEMDMYTDETRSQVVTEFPQAVGLGSPMHFGFRVKSDDEKLNVFPDVCKATAASDYDSTPDHLIIENACSRDSTLQYDYESQAEHFFSVDALRFKRGYNDVYIHCKLTVCREDDSESRCAKGCQEKRRRRSVSSDDLTVSLTLGPLRLSDETNEAAVEERSNLNVADESSSSNLAMIVGALVGVLGMVAIGLIVAVVVITRHRRYAT
ncbi:deleted in malignant brain tumors 1 protein-like isoform X3 [Montipora capricornis]|uniref:deleted in malignant brain tumors 1 protein-like isoform X3 n=1 Tax=Montipora capricornis TaxID=246305 RepID=UPI0035F0FB7F